MSGGDGPPAGQPGGRRPHSECRIAAPGPAAKIDQFGLQFLSLFHRWYGCQRLDFQLCHRPLKLNPGRADLARRVATKHGQGQQDGGRDPTADRSGSRHCPLASKAFRRFHASMKHMITLEPYQSPRELARIAHFVDTDHHRGHAKRLHPDKTSVIRGFAVPGGGSSRRYSWEAHQGMRRSGAPCRPRARGGSTRSARPLLRAGRGAARRTT